MSWIETLETVCKVDKDINDAIANLGAEEARFLVDAYYQMQDDRIRSKNRIRSIEKEDSEEPHEVLKWLGQQSETLEREIKKSLDSYSDSKPIGRWMKEIRGIGPVIAAGLLAHIDIEKAPTAGAIWRFAGLDPAVKWEKNQTRPWNARLKVICWKIGESFMKVSNRPDSLYGRLYRERKELEMELNEKLAFKKQAEEGKKRVGKNTIAYKYYSKGMLPPAHINERAKRYAVKIFLSHLFEKMYEERYNKPAPECYPIAHLDHVHKIEPEVA